MQAVVTTIERFTQAEDTGSFVKHIASLELLRCHPHPIIMSTYDFVVDMTDVTSKIAMELATTDLRRFLHASAHNLMPDMARSFGKQLVAGAAHIHQRNIILRDIKPQSLLVCVTATATLLTIGDFVSSRQAAARASMSGNMVACRYLPPEVFSRCPKARIKYGKPVDVWSMGCVLWELCMEHRVWRQRL